MVDMKKHKSIKYFRMHIVQILYESYSPLGNLYDDIKPLQSHLLRDFHYIMDDILRKRT